MSIYRVSDSDGDRWVISSRQVWKPGSYDTQRTARYAFRFSDEVLQRLQDSVNPGGVITFEMLQEWGTYRQNRVTAFRRKL